jgi:hypothetical protein
MTATEQESMFKLLQRVHPTWSTYFVSGYIHGVQDEGLRPKPQGLYIRDARRLDQYALGYLIGFALHRGTDAESEPWFGFVGELVKDLNG